MIPEPGVAREHHADPVPRGEPGHDVEAQPLGDRQVDLGRFGQQGVRGRQVGLLHADAPVLDREQVAPAAAGIAPPADGDGRVGRGEPHGVLGQLGQQVGDVGDRRAVDERAFRDLERHPVQVLGLGDRRPHDVAQRDRVAPHPRRLLTGEHQQVLGVAAHPRGEVVEAEQLGQRVGVALRLLELVDDLQLAVEHALVAAGEVHQHVRGEPAAADLGVGQLAGEVVLLVLLVLGDPPEQHHADAGEQHRDAVDERPEPRVGLCRGVVEHQRRQPHRADAVADDGEHDVQQERHPVLVERDEADDDEEVEVGLDAPAGDAHQRGRAPDQAGGDGSRPEPPVVAQEAARARADHRDDEGDDERQRRVSEREPDDGQHGDVSEQYPLQEAVTALPVGLAEGVAARKNVDQ